MKHMTGSFRGKITQQCTLTLTDRSNHVINIAEVHGTRKTSESLWNNSKMHTGDSRIYSTARASNKATSATTILGRGAFGDI